MRPPLWALTMVLVSLAVNLPVHAQETEPPPPPALDLSKLIQSSYLGGSGLDRIHDIAVDRLGNVYVTGETFSPNFPTTAGALDTTCGTDGQCNPTQRPWGTSLHEDVFVTKFDPTGAIVYSTYLGGKDRDSASGIAIDAAGNVYLAGSTYSADFPTTPGAFDRLCGKDGQCDPDTNPERPGPLADAFVVKLNPAGTTILYSTYVGGSNLDHPYAIAVDRMGHVYLAGETWSRDYPMANPAQPFHGGEREDAIVTKLDPTGSSLIYSTYLGGSSGDIADAITVDELGNAYVAGATPSSDFPTTPSAYQRTFGDNQGNGLRSDVFVTKFNPTGGVIYSTYLGGNGTDWSSDNLVVDRTGAVYVAGTTHSTNFPTTSGAVDRTCGTDGQCNRSGENTFSDAFVVKLDPSGSQLLYGTYVGGSRYDGVSGMTVDGVENIYLTHWTDSQDFPTTADAFDTTCGADNRCDGLDDFFVAVLNPKHPRLLYSTYLGGSKGDSSRGITLDTSRQIYVVGNTWSPDFPTKEPFQSAFGGGPEDAFVVKLPPIQQADLTITQFFVEPPAQGDLNGTQFTATSGQLLRFTVTFLNQGLADCPAQSLRVAIDGKPFALLPIPPLPHNSMYTWVVPTTWRATVGTHQVTATVDAAGTITETDETNNQRTLTLIVAPAPQLIPSRRLRQQPVWRLPPSRPTPVRPRVTPSVSRSEPKKPRSPD